jgi:transposase
MTIVDLELYQKIRDLESKHCSMRQAARALQLSRVTVRRYWEGGSLPEERKPRESAVPRGEGELRSAIIKLLDDKDRSASRKQTSSATAIHKTLTEELGFCVSKRTVCRIVAELKEERGEATADLILEYRPADVMQVDWCDVWVVVNGIRYKVHVFCAVLPYSYNCFCKIYLDMKLESFIDGHICAFDYFGGVSNRIFYDNLKAAVKSGTGAEAVTQKRFDKLVSHYRFEPVFMNARKGNEKGSVENLCKAAQKRVCTPQIRADSFQEAQDISMKKCIEYREQHKIANRELSIAEDFAVEKMHLKPLPKKRYECHETFTKRVRDNSVIEFNTNLYSVPEKFVGQMVTVVIKDYMIEAWSGGKLVAEHERILDRHQKSLIPHHFVDTLVRKPRAVRNAAVLKEYRFSKPVREFISHFTENDQFMVIINILYLQRDKGVKEIDAALLKAMSNDKYDIITVIKYSGSKVVQIDDSDIIIDQDKASIIDIPKPDLQKYRMDD